MKAIKIYLIFFFVTLVFQNCSDLLDRDPETNTTLEYEGIFKNTHSAPGFLNRAYNYLPSGFSFMGDAMLASACDEAKHSDAGSLIHLLNNNAISPTYNPDNVWDNMYRGIRICNIFLKELDPNRGLIGKYNSIPQADRDNYKGQALFLRAFFHFELIKRYQNIFCVSKVLDPLQEEEIFDIPQSDFQDAANFIANDCDSAAKYLPTILKDKEANAGRPTKAAPMALKSRLLLYAASPLNNPDRNVELWAKAEKAAKDVYDNASSLGLVLLSDYGKIFSTPYNEEVIFATKADNTNTIEQNNFPISYQGKGLTNPTQELVDCYAMVSSTYASPMSGYVATDPYGLAGKKREARFYATILFNNQDFKGAKVESYVGGKDGLYSTSTASKTGYYLRKFVAPDVDLTLGQTVRHSWILFRYAEIILNYAEARNEVLDSPGSDKLLHDLLNLIRLRAGLRNFRSSSEYIKSKDEMREYIKLERRKELALEEHRFWDLRRWKDVSALQAAIHGVKIQKVQNGSDSLGNPIYSFTYESFKVEDRSFDEKFLWYPIPRAEVLKYENKGIVIKQNAGW
jgi:hypothetical protein